MLYSFATAQAEEIYREVSQAKSRLDFHRRWSASLCSARGGPGALRLVVVGEGEETLPELIRAITDGSDPAAVSGIAYKTNGAMKYTSQRATVDLDLYPPFGKILAPIEISRGCPWGCAYCQTPRLFGRKMRHRSIETIARYARCHKDIRFTSPNSLAFGSDGLRPRLEKIEALLKVLAEQKKPIYFGTFPSEVRPEFVSTPALELLTKYCANKSISIGGQSGSPAVLQSIGRGHGPEVILAACELCMENDLTPQVDLIYGLPTGVRRRPAHDTGSGKMDSRKRRKSAGTPLHAPAWNALGNVSACSSIQRSRSGTGAAGPPRRSNRYLVG